jgi:outer membrane immunogenic protein
MHRFICSVVGLLLLWQSHGIAQVQRPYNTLDLTVMFSELHANAPVGGCGCFWMAGGIGELAVPVWRNFSAVAEVNGQHAAQIPGTDVGLGLIGGLGGLRLRFPNHTKLQPFGQALFGGVHGFDSYFPAPVGKLPTTYDTSFAMTIGGGVDIAVSRHIWIRALQADYYYSELRNVQGDRQNEFRLATGIVFRGDGRK